MSNSTGTGGTGGSHAGVTSEMEFYLKGIILPTIGVFGMIGNALNLLVLSRRYRSRRVDLLEKGAIHGLLGLAISDFFFCLGLLPYGYFYKTKTMFFSPSLRMYHQLYASYYQNVFLRISSWLILLVGLARYVVICHPFRARIFISLPGIRIAIAVIFLFWIAFLSPMLWTYSVTEWAPVNGTTIYILDIGYFTSKKYLRLTFMYLWSILGFALPAVTVAFCNVRLIGALRESMKLRKASVRGKTADFDYTVRITATLITLISAFIMLVSPGEILNFYKDVIKAKSYLAFEIALIVTNILQATNFAFHFILYCAVNVTFRRTLVTAFRRWCSRKKKQRPQCDRVYRIGQPTKRFTIRSIFKSRSGKSSRSIESFV